jgi:hypothetical protein
MRFQTALFSALTTLLVVACNTSDNINPDSPYPTLKEVVYTPYTYEEELAHNPRICNPERGFYAQTTFVKPDKLVEASVYQSRVLGRTLHLVFFYLTDYIDGDIAPDYLAKMQESFDNLRKRGGKAIVRFGYKSDMDASYAPFDATQELVARHIEQVKPILMKNADVIFVVQAGFIGAWGEWHTSSNFAMGTEQGYADAKRVVIDGLLGALPKERQVQVRTPKQKMAMYGLALKDTLTLATAHNGSDLARVGGHNDCFLASTSDYGTFGDKRGKGDWRFWDAETRYTIMGGETCGTGAGLHHCNNAIARMQEQHWSYLNINYHSDVIGGWKNNGCFAEISARMGYRFVLQNAFFTPNRKAKAGGDYRVVLNILNDGWAAPMNPRGVELVLMDSNGERHIYKIDSDPRFWFEGTLTTIDTTITLPNNLPAGEYRLYLNLPDGHPNLAENPLFSIRLLNKDSWNQKYGYNFLTSFEI